jgi:hypothetical protein
MSVAAKIKQREFKSVLLHSLTYLPQPPRSADKNLKSTGFIIKEVLSVKFQM